MSEDRRMEAEQRYIAGNETLAELAKSTGLPLSTLKKWCKTGDWVGKRAKLKKRALRRAATQAAGKKARELARLLEASDAMERALLASARTIAVMAEEKPDVFALTESETVLNYSKSLEKLASARTMTGGAISAAEAEKIKLMKKKQAMEEKKAAQAEQEAAGGVRFEIGPDEESEAYSQ
ncbi:MAG: hypothetical protein IKH30_01620 [Clostridia bacterium]|nr:hypothetical protein [Clostridia bacterium]MBR4537227.1 hypothetical protein [Clostridia bacterium]